MPRRVAGFRRVAIPVCLICLVALGCGHTVRVLDDGTGQPIAGVSVTPVLDSGLFSSGKPVDGAPSETDEEGRASVRYKERRTIGYRLSHPDFRQFSPLDRPHRDRDGQLLYMRRPPSVVLLLPIDYSGPVIVTWAPRTEYRDQSHYEVPVPDDPYLPVRLPAVEDDLVRFEEIEARRNGERIGPAPTQPKSGEVYVWAESEIGGMFYENHFVRLLFIGTAEQFSAFERALADADPGSRAMRLTRQIFDGARTPL